MSIRSLQRHQIKTQSQPLAPRLGATTALHRRCDVECQIGMNVSLCRINLQLLCCKNAKRQAFDQQWHRTEHWVYREEE